MFLWPNFKARSLLWESHEDVDECDHWSGFDRWKDGHINDKADVANTEVAGSNPALDLKFFKCREYKTNMFEITNLKSLSINSGCKIILLQEVDEALKCFNKLFL